MGLVKKKEQVGGIIDKLKPLATWNPTGAPKAGAKPG